MERLGAEISSLAADLAAGTARWLALVAEFDDGLGWNDGGFKSCAHWLSWRCGIAAGTARDHVRLAHGLRERPLIAEAFERGELSYSKVRALVRVEPEVDEQQLLTYARGASACQLERIVRGYRSVRAREEDAEAQWEGREFSWRYDEAGALVFSGRLPAEAGALVVRALEAARDELGPPDAEKRAGVSAETPERVTPVRARNADALLAVAQSALAERATSADVYQVVVHVEADALAASANATTQGQQTHSAAGDRSPAPPPAPICELEDGQPLPFATGRRLACDASVIAVSARGGKPVSVGRKTRTISPALRRLLRSRDGGCAFPGCAQRHHTDAHHIEHWADGGRTEIDNLVQLCRHHHRLLHEGGFGVRRRGEEFVFTKPDGTRIPQAPRPPRGDCTAVLRRNRNHGLRVSAETLSPVDNHGERFDLSWAVEVLGESRMARRE